MKRAAAPKEEPANPQRLRPAAKVRLSPGRGPFSKEILPNLAEGKAFQGEHIREGVVIRPIKERFDYGPGRVILKKINPDYLLRKKGTEFH